MLEDQARLEARARRPAVLRLARALAPLRSTLAFMSTGAHPDDETSVLLTALALRDGWRVSFACSTRGEGGQNALGTEAGADLGAIRTREMEEAARIIGLHVHWLGFGPSDPVHDFGFSKDGDATFRRWGRERVVERLVRAIRAERPDAVCPTFLDVAGQHGHHRAMTQAAIEAVGRAADPAAFPEQGAAGLVPWTVAKLYLPAWSGAGRSYDDDRPPPPATVIVEAGGRDPVTGEPWQRLAELSRSGHRTQGMGRWVKAGPHPVELHRLSAAAGLPGRETSLADGLPASLVELAAVAGRAGDALREAHAQVEVALAAWPDGPAVAKAAAGALRLIRAATARLPAEAADAHGHRVARKEREFARVLLEARAIDISARPSQGSAPRGSTVRIEAAIEAPDAATTSAVTLRLRAPDGWSSRAIEGGFALDLPSDAALAEPFPAGFDPTGGNGPVGVIATLAAEGLRAEIDIDLAEPLLVLPEIAVTADPPALVLNIAAPTRQLDLTLAVEGAATSVTALLPPGWLAASPPLRAGEPVRMALAPPAAPTLGLATIRVLTDGVPVSTVRRLGYPHTGGIARIEPCEVRLRTLDVALPLGLRLGHVGGGHDRTERWLRAIGLAPVTLDEAALATAELAAFDTILIGIFAFATRPDLSAALPRLHAWVRAGGHLVTLYHRPWDGWDPLRVPLARLAVGQPSIRWRVTDPAAPVTHLLPEHPLLTTPNRIGPADWEGWEKERGLYFAAEWDDAYEAPLAMADEGEAPLRGALVSGRFGAGRHTHTSLVLHTQQERLVPGAFRLMANLVQPAR